MKQTILSKTDKLPNTTFTDYSWRAEYFQWLSHVIRKRLASIDLSEIAADSFEVTKPKFYGNLIVGTNLDDIAAQIQLASTNWIPGLAMASTHLKQAQQGIPQPQGGVPQSGIKFAPPKISNKENAPETPDEAKEVVKLAQENVERKRGKNTPKNSNTQSAYSNEQGEVQDIFYFGGQKKNNPKKTKARKKVYIHEI
jgi:hypothetical protein